MEFKSIGYVGFGFLVLRSQHFCKNCNTFQVREVVEVNTRTATTAAPSVFSEVPTNYDRCKTDVDKHDQHAERCKLIQTVLKSHQDQKNVEAMMILVGDACNTPCSILFMHRSVSTSVIC